MPDLGLLILRVMAGGMLFWLHGWGKAVAVWKFVTAGQAWPFLAAVKSMGFPVPGLWAMLSTMAESAGAFLVVIGLLARWSAVAIAANMMVAMYFHYSRGEGAELAALYLAVMAAIALCGPGRYSLDEKGSPRRKRR